jgi:hypothetical protein
MKIIMLLTLFITIGCILATGCIGQIKKDNVSQNASISPTNTFTPIVNITDFPSSNATAKPGLNGTLIVSIPGWDAELPLSIDNKSAGIVTKSKPITVILEEGNHTIQVCSGVTCVREEVEVKFAKPRLLDFTERLKSEVKFPNPTARIIDYYRSGDGVTVVVEFINPSLKDLTMTADISVGYSYINDRTDQRVSDSARGRASAMVISGQRQTSVLPLDFAYGYSHMFDLPVIGQISTS